MKMKLFDVGECGVMLDKIFCISPYVRLAGMQGSDDWPHSNRLIYDHELLYCIQGSGFFYINDKEYKIVAGTLIVIKPNQPHRYVRDKDNPCECFWLHLDWETRQDYEWVTRYYEDKTCYCKLFSGELRHPEHIRPEINLGYNYDLPVALQVEDKEYLAKQFRNIYEAYLSLEETWHLRANASLYNILSVIYSGKSHQLKLSMNKYNYQVNRMLDFIKNNYHRDISVKEIAEQGIFSPDYAIKVFKSKLKISVSDYLFKYRLDKAKQLFFNMELSISDIACMCGFNSDAYFSQAIKNKTGYSPSELRKITLEQMNKGDQND